MIVSMIHGVVGKFMMFVCAKGENDVHMEPNERRREERKTFFFVVSSMVGMAKKKKKTFYGTFELTESDGGTTKNCDDRERHL